MGNASSAPTCRLCGQSHWSHQAHVWKAGVAEEGAGAGSPKAGRGPVRVGAVVPVAGKASPKPVVGKKPVPVLPPPVAPPDASAGPVGEGDGVTRIVTTRDRESWNEYMRGWRKRQREELERLRALEQELMRGKT